MSGSRRRLVARSAAAAGVLVAGGALLPPSARGHAIDQTYQLPLPLWLYLTGAGAAVAASFGVTAVVARPGATEPARRTVSVSDAASSVASVVLRWLGIAWWFLAIVAGLLLDDASALPAVLFWIGVWVGMPLFAVLFGNPWPSFSPFRSLFAGLEWLARSVGFDRLDLGVPYPPAAERWPAVVLLGVAVWCELILIGSELAGTVARLMIGYTILTLVGMALFGRVAWLRNVELLEVLLAWFGRIGPVARRSLGGPCAGCGEACDQDRCIDCPECVAAAEPGEIRVELRPWFSGLLDVGRAGWSDAAFIVLALAAVSFDGLSETSAWGGVLNALFPALLELVGPLNAIPVSQTIGLAGLYVAFLLAFGAAIAIMRRLQHPDDAPMPLGETAGAYAATVLPIAAGYLVAHYLTLVIQGAIALPGLLRDPYGPVPDVGWIPSSVVWYISVAAIVLGHVVAVVLAHRVALRDAPRRSVMGGLPLVALMIGYTVLSLWIIAQPITLEPGVTPAGG